MYLKFLNLLHQKNEIYTLFLFLLVTTFLQAQDPNHFVIGEKQFPIQIFTHYFMMMARIFFMQEQVKGYMCTNRIHLLS